MVTPYILVQEAPLDSGCATDFFAHDGTAGASAMFVGAVRGGEVKHMILEYYPGMTEKALADIAHAAIAQWPLQAVHIVHRVGCLYPGEVIVFVGVSSAHRSCALTACDYLIDHLKSRAPFWKKEVLAHTERWVESRESDKKALSRWYEQQ